MLKRNEQKRKDEIFEVSCEITEKIKEMRFLQWKNDDEGSQQSKGFKIATFSVSID